MEKINLVDFLEGVQGRPFKELVQHHIKNRDIVQLREGCSGTVLMLPDKFQSRAMEFVDWMLPAVSDKGFWELDCAKAFRTIIAEASIFYGVNLHSEMDNEEQHELIFNLFQIITLSFAYNASLDKKLRKFAGIKKGWFS